MSNSTTEVEVNVFERLWKLWAMICKMIMDGTRSAEQVADLLQMVVDGTCAVKTYLRELVNAFVGPTDGTRTFANSGFVMGYVHPDYKPLIGRPTPKTKATVSEMIEDGKYAEIFGSLGKERWRWQDEGQVVDFCEKNPNKLRKGGYGTFFELEGGFVAFVFVDDEGRLDVGVYSLDFGRIWRAGYRRRIVVPQLAA